MATNAKKLPSGKWRANQFIGIIDGKKKFKSFTADTKKEAELLAANFADEITKRPTQDMTLKEAIEKYISIKENVISPSTVRGYTVIKESYLPNLMKIKLSKLNQETIQQEFNDFAKKYSPKTCRNAHGLVSSVLKMYLPALQLHTTLPQRERNDIYVPDEREVSDILKLVIGNRLEIPFILATQCGLRESEISALKTTNINEDNIMIKEALVAGIKGECLKGPKSYSGYRKIPISKEMFNILMNAADNKTKRITSMSGNDISSSWGKFRSKNNIDIHLNFHALRHHFASVCLLMGMPQKYVAELMGHSSLDMIERVYQHTFPSAMEQYAQQLRDKNSMFLHKILHN